MPDTEIRDLKIETTEYTNCPALVVGEDEEIHLCGAPLVVQVTETIRGDDYGDWKHFSATFPCGHTFADMETGLLNWEFV